MTTIVGLTGGIGSGKTTVAKMFQDLGVPVYIADLEAKQITNEPETLKLIEQQFGQGVIENEQLNRAAMAEIVFTNPAKLSQLNAIIHPLVAEHFKKWIQKHKSEKFIIKETAILFETNNQHTCDFVITVTAPIKIRLDRVAKRDSISEKEILNRINNQWTDEQRVAKSDFVINNTTIEQTEMQVSQIFEEIIKSLE
ncbi:dephospho-CoA kinase [Flavobacterium sp. SM2513]|uniref:dephospho-CoA kinase n=1 Tax=Flavobacterium sp. SM2513 TaxID=3424766 RepID=UPI003D7F4463